MDVRMCEYWDLVFLGGVISTALEDRIVVGSTHPAHYLVGAFRESLLS